MRAEKVLEWRIINAAEYPDGPRTGGGKLLCKLHYEGVERAIYFSGGRKKQHTRISLFCPETPDMAQVFRYFAFLSLVSGVMRTEEYCIGEEGCHHQSLALCSALSLVSPPKSRVIR